MIDRPDVNEYLEGLAELRAHLRAMFAPEPDLAVWEWAEKKLVIPAGEAERAGPLSTEIIPYIREPLECFRRPAVTDLALMFGAQTAKTTAVMIGVSWLLVHQESSILWVTPSEALGRSFSESRWTPWLRASPVLRALIPRDSDRFKLLEQFLGAATLTFVGSNSAANLSMRPRAVVIQDETDKFAEATRREASASDLADQRTKAFALAKRVKTSTPTIESGRIWREYQRGSRRVYEVPCPGCREFITLEFENIKWPAAAKTADGWDLPAVRAAAAYECQRCAAAFGDEEAAAALGAGRWRPTNPRAAPGCESYHLPSWYAPWASCRFGPLAVKYLTLKASWDLKTWDNNERAMPTREIGETQDWRTLAARRESYPARVPAGALILTCGVDVQDDRLEAEVVAWGAGRESWSVEYAVFHGDPSRAYVWRDLDTWLDQERAGADGADHPLECVAIDSGGHYTQEVYGFVKPRAGRRIYAVKGSGRPGLPVVGRASTSNKLRVRLFTLGVDTIKSTLYAWFKVAEAGPGYCHFPDHYDDEFFQQLCAEECRVRFVRGFERREWHKIRRRNEALDCRAYAFAALNILPRSTLDRRAAEAAQARRVDRQGPRRRRASPRGKPWATKI